MKRFYLYLFTAALLLAAWLPGQTAPTTTASAKSLLVVATYVGGADFFEMPIIQRLLQEGWHVQRADINELKPAYMRRFQVVVITDLTRLDPTATRMDSLAATQVQIDDLGQQLHAYVESGGTLWIYGRSSHHMGSPDALNAMNVVLQPWNAQVLHEMARDPRNERLQARYMRFRYLFTDNIVRDPLTEGVRSLWLANHIMVGITSPLQIGPEWKALIRARKGSISRPVVSNNGYPFEQEEELGTQKESVLAAVRSVGKGRILLTGWGATIPFFGYQHIAWEDIMPTQGFDKKRSDWLTFFLQSLNVLAAGAQNVGGYDGGIVTRKEPAPNVINDWSAVKPGIPQQPLFRGIIGASTSLSDGSGTVADYARVAREMGANFIVFTEDLQTISQEGFRTLVAQCKAATTTDFAAIPGLKYKEVNENYKMIFGPNCWPKPSKLHLPDKTIYDPVFLWFESGVPLHLYYNLNKNHYPAYAYRGYNALAVLTFDEGKQIDEALPSYLDNNHHGDLLTPLVVNLTRSPEALRQVNFWYYAPANKLSDWVKDATREYPRYGGWGQGFISSGPRILQWEAVNGHRFTAGRFYVPGTERWRLALKTESDVPLKTVEILENQQVIRTYRPQGNSFTLALDEVHDRQKVLVARVTDMQGRWALTGGITITDGLYRQFLCSDRQNFMGGQQDTRDEKDRYLTIQATAMLDKNTRAGFGNVQTSDARTLNPYGVDGGFGNTFSMFLPVQVRGKTWDEFGYPVFQNGFRYCSRDAILYDLHYTHRFAPDASPWPSPADPWQFFTQQRYFQATVTGYFFPHRVSGVSPTIVDIDIRFNRKVALSKVSDPDQGNSLFWTHRRGFHHAEFRFKKMLKGVPGWDEPPTTTYSDNLPGLLLAAHEGEAYPGTEDVCQLIMSEGKVNTIKAGPDAAHPVTWQDKLTPGQGVAFSPNPGGSGGLFLLKGDVQARVELGYDWRRMYLGLFDTRTFESGDAYNTRLLLFQNRLRETDIPGEWASFRDAFGVAGNAPAYALKVTRGKVVDTRYLLELATELGEVRAAIGQAGLDQRLPIHITGLSDHCTAAIVNNTRKEWLPIGVTEIEAYATVDTRPGASDLFIGNLVRCDASALWCTVLPEGAGFVIDVHNPTEGPVKATLTVPEGLWMLKAGMKTVTVPAGGTVRLAW
ncbi:MAG: hypothetical protein ACYC7E_02505 [Armatimonadota bacterium]